MENTQPRIAEAMNLLPVLDDRGSPNAPLLRAALASGDAAAIHDIVTDARTEVGLSCGHCGRDLDEIGEDYCSASCYHADNVDPEAYR